MPDLNFTLADCDEVARNCLQNDNVKTKDFEIIPRQEDNYIFKITTEKPTTTLTLYAKTNSRPPRIDKILHEDMKSGLKGFAPKITPRFFCGKSELLFFEDLTCQKFQTYWDSFDLKHVQTALDVLAEFHAAAFAYERNTVKNLKEEYDLEDANFEVDEDEDILWASLEEKERLDEIREDLERKQKSSRFAKILCHSNLTCKNILFYYDNGVPRECRLLNFKTKLYAPPMYDVLQLIFFNTDEDFRRCHYQSLLFYYYKQLEEELQKYSTNIDDILSFDDFQMSSYEVLPLIKLETTKVKKDKNAQQEFKEILKFSKLTREDCYAIVNDVIKTTDYDFVSFDDVPENKKNPLSHYRLRIKIRHSSEDKIINCYVKCKPKTENKTSQNCCFMYETFIPKLEELSINTVSDCLPLCHLNRNEDLVLEDLTLKDYRVSNEPFDFNLLSLVVRKLAKFHAGTLLLEEEMSQRLKIDYRMTKDYAHLRKNDSISKNVEEFRNVINLFPEFKTKLEDQNLYKFLSNFSSICDSFRNVASHGNISKEDILIKFDDDVPVDCKFVNYHSVTYRPPASDFLAIMYLTNRQTRMKNEEELTKIYFDELAKIISSYNHKVSKFFSYEEFVESFKVCRPKILTQEIVNKNSEVGNSSINDKLKSTIADLCDACSMLPNL